MTRKEAIEYIVKKEKGSYEELKNQIGTDLLEQFELLGYISKGIHEGKETWSANKFAYRSYNKSFNTEAKDSLIDNILHLLFAKILKVK